MDHLHGKLSFCGSPPPLAKHGGPLWEPLCYTQIGGLVLATFITLIPAPVIYAISCWIFA
jgi:multidrug efflux pump subunit AcrB